MRTLNRPMFRMGGPIKQGIMHGIREPRRGGGRAALVGNPIFPQDASGRAHHNIWASIYGVGSKVLPRAGGIISRQWSKIKPTFKTQPGQVTGSLSDRATNLYKYRMAPFKWTDKAKAFAKENPWWTYGGIPYAATTEPGQAIGKAALVGIPKWTAEALTPKSLEKYLPWEVEGVESAWKDKLEKNLENKVGKKDYGPYTKSDKVTKLKEKTKDERINELLEIMGYDKARKTAVGDALIDASRIITERGTLDKKNIGRDLINPIIEATSKRLDKPEQIREAVGLMQAKADIEASQPSTKLKDLIAIGIDTPEKQEMYLKSQLGQPTTWGAAKSIASKANLTGDNAISAAASQFADNFQGNLLTTKSFKEIIEAPANKGKKESDIIVEFTEKAVKTKGYPPGDYTVGGVLVTVDENGKVTNITR